MGRDLPTLCGLDIWKMQLGMHIYAEILMNIKLFDFYKITPSKGKWILYWIGTILQEIYTFE